MDDKIKLCNMNENIPEIFYIFVGKDNSKFSKINYHNYKLNKTIISSGYQNLIINQEKIPDFIKGNIDYFPFLPNKTTFDIPSSHSLKVVNGYQTEYILEYIRRKYFPTFPSRFSCVYAFGDYESCEKASKLYGWDLSQVKKFQLVKTELVPCIKVAKCNMEFVSLMWDSEIITFEQDSIDNMAKAYWLGAEQAATEEQDIDTELLKYRYSGVLYEYLIEGILQEIEE